MRVLPVPPYDEPSQAVEAGMHYIMNVGDAWFAQVPREGNIYVRAANMHDTARAARPAIRRASRPRPTWSPTATAIRSAPSPTFSM